jgi:hypothetical protein
MCLIELEHEGVDWIKLAHNKPHWRALVDSLVNLRFSSRAGYILTSRLSIRFLIMTLLHGVT